MERLVLRIKVLLTTLALIMGIAVCSNAQWIASGPNMYYNGGRISIGTSGFSAKLVVNGLGDYYNAAWNVKNAITLATGGEASDMAITFNTQTPDNNLRAIVAGYGTQDLHFMRSTYGGYATPVTDLFIGSNGNVGIGKTTPGYKLDVNGVINATGIYVNGAPVSSGGSSGGGWVSEATGIYNNSRVSIGKSGYSAKLVVNGLGDYYNTTWNVKNVMTLATAGEVANMAVTFNTQAADNKLRAIMAGYGTQDLHFMRSTSGGSDPVSDMVIKSNGNIGIGNLSPVYKLDVNGIVNASGIYVNGTPITSGGGSGGWVTEATGVYNNGRVSIGKSGYSAKLVVNGLGDYYNTAWNVKNVLTLATAGEVANMAVTFNTQAPDNQLRAIMAGYGTQDLHFMRSTNGGADPVSDMVIKSDGTIALGKYNSSTPASAPNGKVLSVDANGNLILVPGFSYEQDLQELAAPVPSTVLRSDLLYVKKRIVIHGGEDPEKVVPQNPTFRMYVKGGIMTDKIKVANRDGANWSDYVFEDNYKLPTLQQVEAYVKTNKHLPNIPSAEEVAKDGIDVAEMDAKLLAKIEELTLYLLEQSKKIEELQQQVNSLKKKSQKVSEVGKTQE